MKTDTIKKNEALNLSFYDYPTLTSGKVNLMTIEESYELGYQAIKKIYQENDRL